jgi:hypothetical protein
MKQRIFFVAGAMVLAVSPLASAKDKKDAAPIFAPGLEGPAKADILSQTSSATTPKKWEYPKVSLVYSDANKSEGMREYLAFDGKLWGYGAGLDYLGLQGWELVQQVVVPGEIYSPVEGFTQSRFPVMHMIFKRPLP